MLNIGRVLCYSAPKCLFKAQDPNVSHILFRGEVHVTFSLRKVLLSCLIVSALQNTDWLLGEDQSYWSWALKNLLNWLQTLPPLLFIYLSPVPHSRSTLTCRFPSLNSTMISHSCLCSVFFPIFVDFCIIILFILFVFFSFIYFCLLFIFSLLFILFYSPPFL